MKTILEIAGLSVAAFFALLLVPLAALHLLTRIPRVRESRPIRRVRPATFTVEILDDSALRTKIGSAITGLVRNRISVRGDELGLDYVTGQRVVRKTLKPFKDISASFQSLSGSTGAALAVLDYLARTLPRRRFVLRGELQLEGLAGPGLSLALQDNRGEDSLTVLWAVPLEIGDEGEEGNVVAYQRLAIPAAAWADHRLATALAGEGPSQLLSKNPSSWSFFRAGLECHRIGEDAPARSLYEQALGHDGSNIGALANLGVLERRAHRFARAERLLSEARSEFEGDNLQGDAWCHNPDWYRVRYQLAALYLSRAGMGKGAVRLDSDVRTALVESRALALVTVKTILAPVAMPSPWQRWKSGQDVASFNAEHEELMSFLKSTVAPSVLTLLAGALEAASPQSSPQQPISPQRPTSQSPSVEDSEPVELHSYGDVRAALERKQPDGAALVRFVEAQRQLAPSGYYNLACYQTTHKRWQLAAELLERSFMLTPVTERDALLRTVEKDATLEPLVSNPARVERLREYLLPRRRVRGMT